MLYGRAGTPAHYRPVGVVGPQNLTNLQFNHAHHPSIQLSIWATSRANAASRAASHRSCRPQNRSGVTHGRDPAASDRPCGSGDCYRASGRTHGRTGRPKGLTSGGPRPTSTIKRYLKANGSAERRHAKSCTHGPAPPALGRGRGVLPTVSTASVAARRGLGDVVHRPLSFPFNQLVLSTVTCNLPPPTPPTSVPGCP